MTFGSGGENEDCCADSTRRCLDIFDPRPVIELSGFTRAAMMAAFGTKSRKSPSCFVGESSKVTTPVTFPPGWLKLATNPSFIGSQPTKRIGMVVVAALAAWAGSGPPLRL